MCKHHWIIQPPQGTFSQGTCQVCGEVKEFRNTPEDFVLRKPMDQFVHSKPIVAALLEPSTGRTYTKHILEN